MQRLYKVPEAAALINMSAKTMWKMVSAREIDVVRIGRAVRIPAAAIERLIEEGLTPARVA